MIISLLLIVIANYLLRSRRCLIIAMSRGHHLRVCPGASQECDIPFDSLPGVYRHDAWCHAYC